MSKRVKIEEIREIVKTGRRNLFASARGSGLITWDELQKLISEIPPRPIPDWMKPEVKKWAADFESDAGKARLQEIEATWRGYEKRAEPE